MFELRNSSDLGQRVIALSYEFAWNVFITKQPIELPLTLSLHKFRFEDLK